MKLKLKHAIAAIILMLSFAAPVVAGPKEDAALRIKEEKEQFEFASGYYKRGEYATALYLLRPLADQGNVDAQTILWFMYDSGRGVPQDFSEATRWLRTSAIQGYAIAQINLGKIYDSGRGVPQDFSEATKWYRFAADKGSVEAQYILGNRYAKGEGVLRDYVRSHMWFNLAAAKGHEQAAIQREIIAKSMGLSEVAEAQKLAREWMPTVGSPFKVPDKLYLARIPRMTL